MLIMGGKIFDGFSGRVETGLKILSFEDRIGKKVSVFGVMETWKYSRCCADPVE